MITDSLLGAQIRRFAHYPNFPQREGQAALKQAFLGACESDEQVTATADRMVRTLKFAPLPSDVWEAAEAIAGELSRQLEEKAQREKQREIYEAKLITDAGWWWEACANDQGSLTDIRRMMQSRRREVRAFALKQAIGINAWLVANGRASEFNEQEIQQLRAMSQTAAKNQKAGAA